MPLYSTALVYGTDSAGKPTKRLVTYPYGTTYTAPALNVQLVTSQAERVRAWLENSDFAQAADTSQAERRATELERRATELERKATELRAAQDRLDTAAQLLRLRKNKIGVLENAPAPQQTALAHRYFSQIVQLFIVVLLCLILFKLGCLRCTVSFGSAALPSP